MRRILVVMSMVFAVALTSFTQNPPPSQPSTRPPENNDRMLRPLTAEEVPPNLNFYAIDPLYKPGIPLGWARERIEEKLDRGMLATTIEWGKVYLSWRLLKTDPGSIAFNLYRSAAGGASIKLNAQPIRKTTDFEDPHPQNGVSLWDARTGDYIFGTREASNDNQIAGGLAGDIDPGYPGMECWGDRFFFSSKGQIIEGQVPPQNELVWWDADLLREIHSRGTISKWKGAVLGNTQGAVHHVADILGDWREEIVTFTDGEIRIYSTAILAADRRICLMQDPLYRNDVTHRSMGYTHVPMTSYYLGVKTR